MAPLISKKNILPFLADPRHPFKEKASAFLRWTRERLQGEEAVLAFPHGHSQWTIFSLRGKGKARTTERQSSSLNLRRVFQKRGVASSEGEHSLMEKELIRFFPKSPFLAVPLAGKGNKIQAALGVCWKKDKRLRPIDAKKLLDLSAGVEVLLLWQAWRLEALARENSHLQKIGNQRDDHYQMLVHDLKGPVAEIISNVDLLRYNPNLSEDDREVLESALCGCDSLHRMVADLLDIHKMEEHVFPFDFRACDLRSVLEAKMARMKALAAHKDLHFVARIAPHLPPVKADTEIVERILANLFTNAIAHSYAGRPITVEAEFLKEEGMVRVRVEDQGEGVPKSKQKMIFQKFGQDYKKGARKRYSTGLGLTFCKMAVENHGGKIWVESEEGRGSAFSFTLPAFSKLES